MLRVYILVLTFLATSIFAQSQPSSRLGDLRSFAGNWTCNGTAFATPFGPEHPTTAKIKVAWVLGSYWLHAEYVEKKTARNPHPASGHVYWGWDEGTKKLTGYAVDNFGGHVMVESDGWSGDTIVWSGNLHMSGTTIPTRDTFVRRSAREVQHKTEAELRGQWMTLNEETCRK